VRIGELSSRSGVSVALIKYYLREGVLPGGERTGAPNQVSYSGAHLHRLRLLRALVEEGGLSAAAIKQVLAAVDGPAPLLAALGAAQDAVVPAVELPETDETDHGEAMVADLVARLGWHVDRANPGWPAAVRILATYRRLGHDELAGLLDTYAEAMAAVARRETEVIIDEADRAGTVEAAVTVIPLGAALLTALRTMAQEDASVRRLWGR
jgi:DNA-binding transcriptional MerR regulator